jgi:hypothetical protein
MSTESERIAALYADVRRKSARRRVSTEKGLETKLRKRAVREAEDRVRTARAWEAIQCLAEEKKAILDNQSMTRP